MKDEGSSRRQRSLAIASMIVLAIDVVGMLVLTAMTLKTRTAFMDMFEELDVALPVVTRFMVGTPTVFYLVFFGSLVAALIVKEVYVKSKKATIVTNVAACFGGAAYLAVYVIALFLPLIHLVEHTE